MIAFHLLAVLAGAAWSAGVTSKPLTTNSVLTSDIRDEAVTDAKANKTHPSSHTFQSDVGLATVGGSVGVGTSSPSQKLEVIGDVRAASVGLTGSLTASSGTLTATGSSQYSLRLSSGLNVLSGQVLLNPGSFLTWPDGSISTSAITGSSGSGFVLRTGDAMTGQLVMSATSLLLTGPGGYVTGSSSITASAFFGDASHMSGLPQSGSSQTVRSVLDDFTAQANGATTAFVLSGVPSSPESVDVYRDGFHLASPGDYSFAPNTVTFTTAPAANTSVLQVKYTVNTSTIPGAGVLASTQSWGGTNSFLARVGVGTTNPQTPLDVEGSAQFGTAAKSTFTASGSLGLGGSLTVAPGFSVSAGGGVAFSSVPVMHVGGNNGTLGTGTTFFAFTPESAIRLLRITVTIINSGTGGSGDTWLCSNGTASISVTTGAGLAAGSRVTGIGGAAIAAQSEVSGWLESAAGVTPTANVNCEYTMQ